MSSLFVLNLMPRFLTVRPKTACLKTVKYVEGKNNMPNFPIVIAGWENQVLADDR